jgi:YYY domain-containing protein
MDVLAFWATALLTGALALPIAFRLLRRLPDAGAGVAMPLGLILAGAAYFLLRTFAVLGPGRGGWVAVVAGLAVLGILVARTDRRFPSTWARVAPSLFALAGLFTLLFFGYVSFRAFNPEIAGTEQPMDFMYLNAVLVSPGYPPHDPWLAGERASYYYFGYLQVGFLTAVSGVPTSIGYNLGLAYTFAAAGTAAGSLGFGLARWLLGARRRGLALGAGALAILFLLALGSLSSVFEWAAARGHVNDSIYQAFGVDYLLPCAVGAPADADCYRGPAGARTAEWYPTEFLAWWRPSRVIPETITEFPAFSFLLGDLHPHVMALPGVVLTLALAACVYRGRSLLDLQRHRRAPLEGLAIAVVLGGLAFANTWDLPTFALLFGLAVFARNARCARGRRAVFATLRYLAPVLVVAVVAYLPWYLDFRSQASGFHAYTGAGTRPAHAFLQFGPLLLAGLAATTWGLRRRPPGWSGHALVFAAWIPMLPLLLWVFMAALDGGLGEALRQRTAGGWVTLATYAVTAWLLFAVAMLLAVRRHAGAVVAALAALGALLLFGTELFYIGDIYRDLSPRLNTVFKLSYQAWVLLAVGGAVAVAGAARLRAGGPFVAATAVLAVAGLSFIVTGLPNRTEGFSRQTDIDGLAFVARNDPDDYALLRWLAANAAPGDVVVEASGRRWARNAAGEAVVIDARTDYTDAGRISARSGLQTPIGWYFHEVQWRGTAAHIQEELRLRQVLVDGLYLEQDPARMRVAARELGARYIVVGTVELTRYPGDLLGPLDEAFSLAYASGDLRIYEVPQAEAIRTS